jgi:thioredoxin 1
MTTSQLTDATFDVALCGGLPILVKFSAPWCVECRILDEALAVVLPCYAGRLRCCEVDVAVNPMLRARYAIMALPALYLFKNGEVVWKAVGVLPQHEIVAALNSSL